MCIRDSHKLQPLDRSFMFPLKTYYAQGLESWLKRNTTRVVTHYQVASLFAEAYNKAAKIETAVYGFRVTGLLPCNRNIFQDYEFILAVQNKEVEDEGARSGSQLLPNNFSNESEHSLTLTEEMKHLGYLKTTENLRVRNLGLDHSRK